MDWSNEMVLEFLQYYENEPVIWNPYDENHKKKKIVNDAWNRIKNNVTWECTVDELKKKKDSLMAYYRIHLTKIKKSLLAGEGAEDVYKTNWFAFPAMDTFLRPLYECKTSITTERVDEIKQLQCQSLESVYDDSEETTHQSPSTKSYRLPVKRKQLNISREILAAKRQMNEVFEHIKRKKCSDPQPPSKDLNEYEIFGKLVASKIQKIENPLDREILMNNINNLIFKAVKSSIISQERCETISCTPSPIQFLQTFSPDSKLDMEIPIRKRKHVLTQEGTLIDSEDSTPSAQNYVTIE